MMIPGGPDQRDLMGRKHEVNRFCLRCTSHTVPRFTHRTASACTPLAREPFDRTRGDGARSVGTALGGRPTPSRCILEIRVVLDSPSLAAAPAQPPSTPFVACKVADDVVSLTCASVRAASVGPGDSATSVGIEAYGWALRLPLFNQVLKPAHVPPSHA